MAIDGPPQDAAATAGPPSAGSDSIRVAVATKEGLGVDLHFGHVHAFDVFEAGPAGIVRLERRSIDQYCKEDDDRATRMKGILQVIGDCKGVLVARIGPVPKEMLGQAGLDAVDDYAHQPVEEAVAAFVQRWRSRGTAEPAPPVDTDPGTAHRVMHTMLRVSDIDRSVDFYTRLLGMQVISRREHRKNQFTQVYLGYGADAASAALELVQNWDREAPYQQGDAFGHLAIAVSGITALCHRLAAAGVPMPRPPHSQRHGETIVAFVEDPDGYRIELVQAPVAPAQSP